MGAGSGRANLFAHGLSLFRSIDKSMDRCITFVIFVTCFNVKGGMNQFKCDVRANDFTQSL